MGCRVTTTEKVSAMFDSVTGFAFGPTFPTEEECEDFIQWCFEHYDDPRSMKMDYLEKLHGQWYLLSHNSDDDAFHAISSAVGN